MNRSLRIISIVMIFALIVMFLSVYRQPPKTISCEDFTLLGGTTCTEGDLAEIIAIENPLEWQIVIGDEPESYSNRIDFTASTQNSVSSTTLYNCSSQPNGVLVSVRIWGAEQFFAVIGPYIYDRTCADVEFEIISLQELKVSMENRWVLDIP